LSVAGDEVYRRCRRDRDFESLRHRSGPLGFALPAPDLTDLFCIYTKEDRQLRDPLLEGGGLRWTRIRVIAGALAR